jgi:S-adenosyl methyltransferase
MAGSSRCRPDIREPGTILDHPGVTRLIDFGEPAAVLCVAVLHLVPDAAGPEEIIARFRDRICAGSYLVLSRFADDSDPAAMAALRAVAAGTPVETHFRSRRQIRGFFGGFELMEPGLAGVQDWREHGAVPTRLKIAGAVGRKR